MSRFYAELHDRELLVQAESILTEIQRRSLMEVFIPLADATSEEIAAASVFPRRLASISTSSGRLKLTVEDDFFRHS